MIIRILILLLSTMLLIAMPAAAQENFDRNSPEFRDNTSQFMCLCGCGQDHHECDMEACGLNEQFKTEILEFMNDGHDKDFIKNHYVEIYGEVILTAPEKSGFSLTAWVTPFVILAGAGAGVLLLIRKWVRKSAEDRGQGGISCKAETEPEEPEDEVLQSLVEEERKKHF